MLYVFGNVTYASGPRVSSRLLKKPVSEIPEAKPTLRKQTLIDSMDTAIDWNWVPAYTDPCKADATYFADWKGEGGQRGFTLHPQMFNHQEKMHYYFGTRKIGDPQFRGESQTALLLDCWPDAVPAKLTVRLSWREPGTYGEEYTAAPSLDDLSKVQTGAAVVPNAFQTGQRGAWLTIRMQRSHFRSKEGRLLPDWKNVDKFILVGTNPPCKPPVFKRLRWEE